MSHRKFWPLAVLATIFGTACSAEKTETAPAILAPEVSSGFKAPDEAWRTVNPENLLIIDTKYGDIGVEMFPEIAPNHVTKQAMALMAMELGIRLCQILIQSSHFGAVQNYPLH